MDLKRSTLELVSLENIMSVEGYGWHTGVLSGGQVRSLRPLGTSQTLRSCGDIGAAGKEGLELGPGQMVSLAQDRGPCTGRWIPGGLTLNGFFTFQPNTWNRAQPGRGTQKDLLC